MRKGHPEFRKAVYNKYKKRCAYCGERIDFDKFHIDHLIPVRRGDSDEILEYYGIQRGDHSLLNCNPSCAPCNLSKSSFTLEKWRNELSLKLGRLHLYSSSYRTLKRFGKVREYPNKKIVFYFEKFKSNE